MKTVSIMKSKFIALIVFILIGANSFSTHFAGGNIYYDCLGNNQYKIWVEVTTDCLRFSGTPFINVSLSNSCGIATPSITMTDEVALRKEVSQICPAFLPLTTCNSGTQPGRTRHVYSGTVTLPPCNTWTISCAPNARNAAVTNLVNPQGSMYMETTLNSVTDSCNNSVRYTGVQNPYVCINSRTSYNFGGFDPDGDSLVYTLVGAKSAAGTFYTYVSPYTSLNPISGIALNYQTGTITFTPNSLGYFVVVVKVFEYDSTGNLKGTTIRDIQIVVYNCSGNLTPNTNLTSFYNLRGQGVIAGPKKLEVCEGDIFCVDFEVSDSNLMDTLSLWSTNISSVLPGATLSFTGINPVIGTICWTVPSGGNALNSISVTADDGVCPIPAQSSFSLTVEVIKSTRVSPDVTICLGDSTVLTASGGNKFVWNSVSGPPLSMGVNFSCDTCNPVEAKPVSTSVYEVVSDLSGGCQNKDTVTVTVAPNFLYNLSQSSPSSCRLDPVDFAITPITPGTYTYKWSPGLMLSSDTVPNPVLSPTQGGLLQYQIVAVNAKGCTKIDTISIYVSNSSVPSAQASTDKDTVVCNDIANLSSVIDTAAAQSDFIDDFDDAFSPYSFLSTVTGGAIGSGCGSSSPPYSLNFNGSGIRTLQTASIQTGNCTTFEYDFRLGNASSGFLCDNAENSDPVLFQYSTNGGVSWVTIRNHNFLGWLLNTGWQHFSFNMPAGVTNAIFRWHQPRHGGFGQDNWAIDNIKISCSSLNNYSYVWTPTPGLGTPNQPNTTAQPQVGTNYMLVVTDTTGGCSDTAFTYVEATTDYPQIDISIDTSDGCEPVTVAFTNNTDPKTIGTVEWDFGDGNTSNALTNPMIHTYTSGGIYSVYVKITSPNGCVSDTTYSNLIEVFKLPEALFEATPQPTNISNPNISFFDLSSAWVSQWNWTFGVDEPGFQNTSTLPNPTVRYPDDKSGNYEVTLIVTTPEGCADTTTKTIIIDGLYTLYLPSSFTPNEDGLNELFGPEGEKIDPKGYKFMIFDRWGQIVFSTTDVFEKWDGKLNGELLPEGTYIWRILASDGNTQEEHEYFGHVTILRKQKP